MRGSYTLTIMYFTPLYSFPGNPPFPFILNRGEPTPGNRKQYPSTSSQRDRFTSANEPIFPSRSSSEGTTGEAPRVRRAYVFDVIKFIPWHRAPGVGKPAYDSTTVMILFGDYLFSVFISLAKNPESLLHRSSALSVHPGISFWGACRGHD